jgi:predicted porin
MKKSLLALAALTAFAGAASAQSSVTLFGVVDVAARYQKNGSAGELKTLTTDGNASSRLGFRGVEDLGGGLRAGFWLEGALAADTGNALSTSATTKCTGTGTPTAATCVTTTAPGGAQTWQRRSTVSLLGAFGEIRLGRDYTPTFWDHTVFDPFGTNGVGAQANLMVQASASGSQTQSTILGVPGAGNITSQGQGTFVRANNTIGYFLPAIGGLYGQAMVAAGEGLVGNKYYGARLGYAAGPINIAGAYGITPKTAGGPPQGASAGTVINSASNAMIDDLTAWDVAGTYDFGVVKFWGQYHEYTYGPRKQKNALAGITVPLGAGTIKATYGQVGGGFVGAKQYAVGYVYDLSKRTALYAHAAQIDNDPSSTFVVGNGTGPSLAGGTGPANMKPGEKSTGYEFGIRHSF